MMYDICQVQVPNGLQLLRAPYLQTVNLENNMHHVQSPNSIASGEKLCAMPMNTKTLAWLLHHSRLRKVSISATKVTRASLLPFQAASCMHRLLTALCCSHRC